MKYYYAQTGGFRTPIEEVETDPSRETANFIQISGHRSRDAKQGNGRGFFKTYYEAKQFIVNVAKAKVFQFEERLLEAKKELDEAEKL